MTDPQTPFVAPDAAQPAPVQPLAAEPVPQPAPVQPVAAPLAAEPVTQPVTWASPATPPVDTAPAYAQPVYAQPVYAPPAVPQPAAVPEPRRRNVGPAFILTAVLATAVLSSGGTYLAVTAAHGTPAATAPAFVPAVSGGTPPAGQVAPNAGSATPVAPPATTPPAGQAAPVAPAPATGSVVDIVKAVSPAVVTIVAEGVTETDPTTGQSGTGTATGSGVIFDANGLILTNHHVVAGSPSKLTVNLKDGRSFDATIYGTDTLTDLAIVKVNQSGLPTAPIGDSSTIQVGQQAIAIGSPLGEFTDSVTSGIVSAIGRSIDVDGGRITNLIQTDTAINPGNSGGPLLDPSGKVIGINTAVAGSAQGIGFAIPINIARPLLAQASAGQKLARPWLGIRFETITPAVKAAANLSVDNGAWIPSAAALAQGATGQDPNAAPDPNAGGQDPFGGLFPNGQNPFTQGQGGQQAQQQPAIVAGSPAEQAGLAEGDIITAVNGSTLDAAHPLDLVLSQLAPGQTAALSVLRNGQATTINVTLGTRPTDL